MVPIQERYPIIFSFKLMAKLFSLFPEQFSYAFLCYKMLLAGRDNFMPLMSVLIFMLHSYSESSLESHSVWGLRVSYMNGQLDASI